MENFTADTRESLALAGAGSDVQRAVCAGREITEAAAEAGWAGPLPAVVLFHGGSLLDVLQVSSHEHSADAYLAKAHFFMWKKNDQDALS